MSEEPRLLLIGSHGFVGGHIHEAVGASAMAVVTADRAGDWRSRCNLLDPASIATCLRRADPTLIVNMAGAASVAASWEQPDRAFAVNTTGTGNLLEAVAELVPSAHVLCVSSGEVYGEPEQGRLPFREEQPPRPVTPYGESKAMMEAACGYFSRNHGLQIAVVRAFTQVGPGQSRHYAASDFARQIALAEREGADSVDMRIGNPAAARDFTDVRDSARAFVEISRRRLTGIYNLCSGTPVGIGELIELLGRATSLPLRVTVDQSRTRPVDPSVVYGDPGRLQKAIGWGAEIPLAKTVADLLEWWRGELARA